MSDQASGAEASPVDEGHGTARLLGPEDRGAAVAESHLVVTEHDGNVRVDIAEDATARPGPGPGESRADGA